MMPYNLGGIEFHPRYEGKIADGATKRRAFFTLPDCAVVVWSEVSDRFLADIADIIPLVTESVLLHGFCRFP